MFQTIPLFSTWKDYANNFCSLWWFFTGQTTGTMRRGFCWSQTGFSWSANTTSSCSAVCGCNGFPWVLSMASAWASFPSLQCHWTSEYDVLDSGKWCSGCGAGRGNNHHVQFSAVSWENPGENSDAVAEFIKQSLSFHSTSDTRDTILSAFVL